MTFLRVIDMQHWPESVIKTDKSAKLKRAILRTIYNRECSRILNFQKRI